MDFVIIGAQKAATTWLTYSLKKHSEIYLPKDEIPVFEYGYNDQDYYAGIRAMYDSEGKGRIKGIKNTHLMFYEECPKLLHDRFPHIKIIVVLRNPVERAISSYFWHMRVGAIPLLGINDGFRRLLDLGRNSKDWQTIFEPGFYSKHIKRYYSLFKRDQFYFILHEEIKSHPRHTLSGLLTFLCASSDLRNIDMILERSRPKESIYHLIRIGWLRLRNHAILYKSMDGRRILWKDTSNQHLHHRLLNAFVVGVDRMILSKVFGNTKPEISPKLKEEIGDLYANDIRELGSLIGKRIPRWLEL